jgi:hypothetical protein
MGSLWRGVGMVAALLVVLVWWWAVCVEGMGSTNLVTWVMVVVVAASWCMVTLQWGLQRGMCRWLPTMVAVWAGVVGSCCLQVCCRWGPAPFLHILPLYSIAATLHGRQAEPRAPPGQSRALQGACLLRRAPRVLAACCLSL